MIYRIILILIFKFINLISRQAFLQIENLQKQLDAITVQRDNALHQLMLTQEQLQQRELSLNNLQNVLEQFQKGTVKYYFLNEFISLYRVIKSIFLLILDQASLNATELQLLEQQLKKMKRENEELQRREKESQVLDSSLIIIVKVID